MISIQDLSNLCLSDLLQRQASSLPDVTPVVEEILQQVKQNGDDAVLAYTKKFDKADLSSLEVTAQEIQQACQLVSPQLVEALEQAAHNIRAYHQNQVRTGFAKTDCAGMIMGQRILPLETVGIYVPGGTAAYPSTVLMNAIPAVIAGVKNVIMVTPPNPDGTINPNVLVASKIAGVNRIFKTGGAQAIGALAYGTQTIPQVDKITGPGNLYVATAKRLVYGMVDIDMVAGPSEILIIADDTANPTFLAADLLSQAEHDVLASAVLVTTSKTIAEQVNQELELQLSNLSRQEIARQSLQSYGRILLVDNLEDALNASNILAPEHLELCIKDPFAWLGKVRNAGSVFLGNYTPEALGDYFAGPNHTLPTSGTARFASPLSVDDFVKKTSYLYYSEEALLQSSQPVELLAQSEGLSAHANSVSVRKKQIEQNRS